MKGIVTTIIIILICQVLVAQREIRNNTYSFVFAYSMNLREQPNTSSRIIQTIPYLSIVKTIEVGQNIANINGLDNYWIKINYNDSIGYIFGGYVVPIGGKKDSVIILKKELPLIRWVSVLNKTDWFDINTKFVDRQNVPVYKTKDDIVNKKVFTNLNGFFIFRITDKFYNGLEYETASYSQFEHPEYGKLWISNNRFNCIASVKRFNDYTILLSTTEPVIEGDRNDYRLIISKNNKIIDATLAFKDVGPYADAKILQIDTCNSTMTITLSCIQTDTPAYFAFDYTNAIFNLKTEKIESLFEYAFK